MKTQFQSSTLSRVRLRWLSFSWRLCWVLCLIAFFGLLFVQSTGLAQTTIVCGQTVIGQTASATENAIYSFGGRAGEVVAFAVEGFTDCQTYSLNADVYDPNSKLLTTINACGPRSANLTLAETGSFTIRVHDSAYAHTGSYALSAQDVIGGGCGGTPITCGQTVTNKIDMPTQMSAWAYAGAAGEVVAFSVEGFTDCQTYSLNADVYDPNGKLLTTINACGPRGANVTMGSTGTFTILVHDSAYEHTGSYALSVQDVIGGGCGSTAITCGQTVTNKIDMPTQMTAWAYAGAAGEVVAFAVEGFTDCQTYSLNADIYDPAGKLLTTINACGPKTANVNLGKGGILTIVVHDSGYANTGSYSLSASDSAGCPASPSVSVVPTPAGSNATLTAAPTGPAPLFYQWRLAGKPIMGATNATITIPTEQANNVGYYDLLVGDPGGTVASIPLAPYPHAATATASLANGYVVAVNITDPGWGYTNTPPLRFIGGGGNGAAALAVLTNGIVIASPVQNPGSSFSSTPIVVIEPPFIPQPTMGITGLSLISFTNLSVGIGYQLQNFVAGAWSDVGASFTATNSTLTQYSAAYFWPAGGLRAVTLPAPEQAYATAQVVNGFVVGATVTSGGRGYTTNPAVTILNNGAGSNATATASVSGGVVIGIATTPGIGYFNGATITIAPPPVNALLPAVTQVMELGVGSLSPYDGYQLQFSSVLGGNWGDSGPPFIPKSSSTNLYINVSGSPGFFRVKFVGF